MSKRRSKHFVFTDALVTFQSDAMAWVKARPREIAAEGPRLVIGRLAHDSADAAQEAKVRAMETEMLKGMLVNLNVSRDIQLAIEGRNSRANGLLVTLSEFVGIDYPCPSVLAGLKGLPLSPAPSGWMVYGMARWALVSRTSSDELAAAGKDVLFTDIVPHEDIRHGIALFGGLAMGASCTVHDVHEPETMFIAASQDGGDEWQTFKSLLASDAPARGAFGLAVDWATETGFDAPLGFQAV